MIQINNYERPVSCEAGHIYVRWIFMFKKLYSRFIDKIVERVKKELKEDLISDIRKLGITNRE